MPTLRLRVITQKAKKHPRQTLNFRNYAGRIIQERIHKILDSDVLPLIIAPSIFMIFAGLEWWRWYLEIPTPIPLLLTVFALGLGVYCSHKLFEHKKHENRQKDLRSHINRHPELH